MQRAIRAVHRAEWDLVVRIMKVRYDESLKCRNCWVRKVALNSPTVDKMTKDSVYPWVHGNFKCGEGMVHLSRANLAGRLPLLPLADDRALFLASNSDTSITGSGGRTN